MERFQKLRTTATGPLFLFRVSFGACVPVSGNPTITEKPQANERHANDA
jgi:hypothetical protein